jgi:FKBP12-rapamycin complex-associated protein
MGWTRAPGPSSHVESAPPTASEAETADDIAALISINNQLQLPEAAEGMLAFSRELGVEPQVRGRARYGFK